MNCVAPIIYNDDTDTTLKKLIRNALIVFDLTMTAQLKMSRFKESPLDGQQAQSREHLITRSNALLDSDNAIKAHPILAPSFPVSCNLFHLI